MQPRLPLLDQQHLDRSLRVLVCTVCVDLPQNAGVVISRVFSGCNNCLDAAESSPYVYTRTLMLALRNQLVRACVCLRALRQQVIRGSKRRFFSAVSILPRPVFPLYLLRWRPAACCVYIIALCEHNQHLPPVLRLGGRAGGWVRLGSAVCTVSHS